MLLMRPRTPALSARDAIKRSAHERTRRLLQWHTQHAAEPQFETLEDRLD